MQALLILLRQSADYCQKSIAPFGLFKEGMGSVSRIRDCFEPLGRRGSGNGFPACAITVFQDIVAGGSKRPCGRFSIERAPFQALKQEQENFLDDLFRVGQGDPAAREVAKQGEAQLIKQDDHLVLQRRCVRRSPAGIGEREQPIECQSKR